jgi:hypothetical protein
VRIAAGLSLIRADRRCERGAADRREPAFSAEFLEYFAVVDDTASASGRAALARALTVPADPAFALHREIAAAGRRARPAQT